jgi:hypothetical protein
MINLNEIPTSGYNSFSVGVPFFWVILNVQFLHKKNDDSKSSKNTLIKIKNPLYSL